MAGILGIVSKSSFDDVSDIDGMVVFVLYLCCEEIVSMKFYLWKSDGSCNILSGSQNAKTVDGLIGGMMRVGLVAEGVCSECDGEVEEEECDENGFVHIHLFRSLYH